MSKLEVLSAVHGVAPRSDELHGLYTAVSKGRSDPAPLDELAAAENAEWLNWQAEAGIDLRSQGKLDWFDYVRPIIKATSGFKPGIDSGPLTRWYETNTFFRRPSIVGELSLDTEALPPLEAGANLVSLVAPFTLYSLCENETNESDAKTKDYIADLYDQLIGHYAEQGVKEVVLKEYTSQYPVEQCSADKLGYQLAVRLAGKYPQVQFGYLGSTRHSITLPDGAPPNLGVSLTHTGLQALGECAWGAKLFHGRDIWVPVVFADDTNEDQSTVNEWDPEAVARIAPARIILTNTVDFRHLPRRREASSKYGWFAADDKLIWLGEEAAKVGAVLGGAS